tara:strand:+ start:6051 stop:6623 length:573 start_codon:yes stop_codon:yes gene_type:complete
VAFVEAKEKIAWSEPVMARALFRTFFSMRSVVLVPNCNWTGHECDLLCVDKSLRIVDVEIKISRSDFKADAKKEKWWDRIHAGYEDQYFTEGRNKGRLKIRRNLYKKEAREWPPRVWKHYFALPADIWTDDLLSYLPSKNCGVILVYGKNSAFVKKRARPNRDAEPVDAATAIHIARLANLRFWDLAVSK